MSEAYRGARSITTAGITLGATQGIFLGVLNGGTAQNIFIAGSAMFDMNTKSAGITLFTAAGCLIPVKCSRVVPQSGTVFGVFD